MNDDRPRAPAIAIGAATLAVVMSLIALVVVAMRSPKGSEGALASESMVSAADFIKLKRDSVEIARDEAGVIGVRVKDQRIREALGLQPGDVIAALAGRQIKREYDITDAIQGAAIADAQLIYVDLLRDDKPLLLRWKLDENLRALRKIDSSSQPPGVGMSSSDPFSNPPAPPVYGGSLTARDPLLDTVTKIDDFHYRIPRSTVERVLANPLDFAKGARVVPGMSMGRVEGLKVYAIRPNSIYATLGFENGDLVRTVNGFELSGIDKALETYTKLKDATSLEVELTRRGREETLYIKID